jgi:hypothetical protein
MSSRYINDEASIDGEDDQYPEEGDEDADADDNEGIDDDNDDDDDDVQIGFQDNLEVMYGQSDHNVGDRLDQEFPVHGTSNSGGGGGGGGDESDMHWEDEARLITPDALQTYERLFNERIPFDSLNRPLVYRVFLHAKTQFLIDGYSSLNDYLSTVFEMPPLTDSNFHYCSQQWTIKDIRQRLRNRQKVVYRLGEMMIWFSLAQWDAQLEYSKQACGLETFEENDGGGGNGNQQQQQQQQQHQQPPHEPGNPTDAAGTETASSRSTGRGGQGRRGGGGRRRGSRKQQQMTEEDLLKQSCLDRFRRYQKYLQTRYGPGHELSEEDRTDNNDNDRPDMFLTEYMFEQNAHVLHEMRQMLNVAAQHAELNWAATSMYSARVNGQERRFGQLAPLYENMKLLLDPGIGKQRTLMLARYIEHKLFLQNAVRSGPKGNDVYLPVHVTHPEDPDRQIMTPAWEYDKKLDKKVNEYINAIDTPELYQVCFPGSQEFNTVVDNLGTDEHKVGFPKLEFDRHVFAFQNAVIDVLPSPVERGINGEYLGKEKPRVYEYTRDPLQEFQQRSATCLIPTTLDTHYASSYYFDQEHFMEIPTPALDTVFGPQIESFRDHAGLGHEPRTAEEKRLHDHEKDRVFFTVYALIGRLFYDIHECDNWQVILEIVGYSNTGKTTLNSLLRKLYSAESVMEVDCSGDSKWNLAGLQNALFYSLDETKSETSFNGTTFNRIVDGSAFDCNDKFGKYHQGVRVRGHGIMTGNLPLGIEGEGKERRIVPLRFRHSIRETDTNLEEKLLKELALIVLKCSLAYHFLLQRCANTKLWDDPETPYVQRKLPYCFYYFAEERSSSVNVLTRFIKDTFGFSSSWSVEERKRHAVPFRYLFMAKFREYLQKIQHRSSEAAQMQPDYYRSTFEKLGIQFLDESRASEGQFRGEKINDFWLCGIYEPIENDVMSSSVTGSVHENPSSVAGAGAASVTDGGSVSSHHTGEEVSEGRSTDGSRQRRQQQSTSSSTSTIYGKSAAAAGAQEEETIPADLVVGSKRGRDANEEPSIWPPAVSASASTSATEPAKKRPTHQRKQTESHTHASVDHHHHYDDDDDDDDNGEEENVQDGMSFMDLMED